MSTFDQYVFKLMLHCGGTVVEENLKTFMFVHVLCVHFFIFVFFDAAGRTVKPLRQTKTGLLASVYSIVSVVYVSDFLWVLKGLQFRNTLKKA